MKSLKTLHFALLGLVLLLGLVSPALAQIATTQPTLSTALTDTTTKLVVLSSGTGISKSTVSNQYYIEIDQELMKVQPDPAGTTLASGTVAVIRGYGGTFATPHAANSPVYFGQVGKWDPLTGNSYGVFLPFGSVVQEPIGTCSAANAQYLPMVAPRSGRVWNCINSRWLRDDGYLWVPGNACNSTVSANSTGTQGLTTVGASTTPVVQAQTSASGTNTHTYICPVDVESRLNLRGIVIRDVTFLYGVQTTALGTQVATLASGTFNGSTVFSTITFPAAANSETASTVTPVRADAGTMVITPTAANANVATTTAGAFYSVKFTPATPFNVTTDLQELLVTVTLQNTATSATITNSPGMLVHYAYGLD